MMKLPPLEYTFDNVVLGWREEAVSFAREHGYHLIVNSDQRHFRHVFGLKDVKNAWYTGIFELGMKSLLPVPFDIQTIGFEGDKLKVVTAGNTKILINFSSLHLFDLDNCLNLGLDEVVEDYLVHDYFDITAGTKQAREIHLEFNNSFIKVVKFVPTNRVDHNKNGDYKDMIVRSIISAEDIRSFDFSETVVRIFLERKLRELKIYQPKPPSSNQNRNIKFKHSLRHIIKHNFQIKPVCADTVDDRIIIYG